MGKSTMLVGRGLLQAVLLGGLDADVVDARMVDGQVEVVIVGPDVPDVPRVRAIISQTAKLEAA